MDRDEQIRLMETVEQRQAEYVRKWLRKPEVKAALRRYDFDDDRGASAAGGRRVVCGG